MQLKNPTFQILCFFFTLSISSNTLALKNDNNEEFILDRINDTVRNPNWKLSSNNFNKRFEYFDNTSQLTGNQLNTCSKVISKYSYNLGQVDGIWVVCHDDSALPIDCESFGSSTCYPEISFPKSQLNPGLQFVKLKIALFGFATLRFNVGNYFCIDYSFRKDPLSQCQYVEILPQLQWVDVEIKTDESINFRTFSVQLFTQFKEDAVLVDKIEAFASIFPSATLSDELFKSILDNEMDASLPGVQQWQLPNLVPKWLDYYVDYENFLGKINDPSTCANLISSRFITRALPNVPGIWSSCRKSVDCDSNPSTCHPAIYYKAPEEHFIYSIKSNFYIQNTAIIKLHAGGKCWDFSFEEVPMSPCKFFLIPNFEDRWHAFFWTGKIFLPNQEATEFRLELISQSSTDVVLLDKLEVQYKQCENIDNCLSEPTNPPGLTSTLDPATTEEGSTTTDCDSSTTTEENKLTDSTTNVAETSESTDVTETESIETTTTTDSDGTICTTRVTRTTTPRSGSSTGAVISVITFIAVLLVVFVK